jgi:hypothetical protein
MWTGRGNKPQQQTVARDYCYDDVWDPAKYQWKSTEDLEFWARSLKLKMKDLIATDPFPASLFDKLENRYEAIMKEVNLRRKNSNQPDVEASRKRARSLLAKWEEEESSSASSTSPTPTQTQTDYTGPRFGIRDAREAMEEMRESKRRREELNNKHKDANLKQALEQRDGVEYND